MGATLHIDGYAIDFATKDEGLKHFADLLNLISEAREAAADRSYLPCVLTVTRSGGGSSLFPVTTETQVSLDCDDAVLTLDELEAAGFPPPWKPSLAKPEPGNGTAARVSTLASVVSTKAAGLVTKGSSQEMRDLAKIVKDTASSLSDLALELAS